MVVREAISRARTTKRRHQRLADLLRYAEVPLPSNPPDAFDDDNGTAGELAANRLSAIGVVNGTGDREYSPNAGVRRGQMASYLMRAHRHATGSRPGGAPNAFSDDEGPVHEPNIDDAAHLGVAAGYSDGTFKPSVLVARDQMASFVAGALDAAIAGGAGSPTGTWTGVLARFESRTGFQVAGIQRGYACGDEAAQALADRRADRAFVGVTAGDAVAADPTRLVECRPASLLPTSNRPTMRPGHRSPGRQPINTTS